MGKTLELIPHDILANDFPYFLTEDYVHWMDTATGTVEFRPLDQLWSSTSLNWLLDFSLATPSMMFRGEKRLERLVDIRSQTFQGIHDRLRPLEHATHLTIMLDMDRQPAHISIDLPRFRLSFFVNDRNELESYNMHNMVIDDNQCTGTMIGLKSQLVLCHKDSNFASLPRSRMVIIPHGTVQFLLNKDHVSITTDTNCKTQRQVAWHKFDIDTDLGLLVGSVDLTSRLFKIYLHALCSHPLPDPLTAQTGTDHALQELRGAGCFSFQRLEKADTDLLRLIGDISPPRCYYPKHLRVMQTTEWSARLPVLSQHRSFYNAASRVLDYAQSLTIFPELCQEIPSPQCINSDPVLTARAGRHAIYYQGDIAISSHSDRRYIARDCLHNKDAEMEALKISRLVYSWPMGLAVEPSSCRSLQGIFEKWGVMQGPTVERSLTYSQNWLSFTLSQEWLSIYKSCRKVAHADSKFTLIFSFSALAYRNEADLTVHIPILLACATISSLLPESPPQHVSYSLNMGYKPLRSKLLGIVRSNMYGIDDSPATHLRPSPDEAHKKFKARLRRHYEDLSRPIIDNAVDFLMAQWPCHSPETPFHGPNAHEWFRTEEAISAAKQYFSSCFANHELKAFVSRISEVLQQHYTPSPLNMHILPSLQFLPKFNPTYIFDSSRFTLEQVLTSHGHSAPLPQRVSHKFGDMGEHLPPRSIGQPVDTTALASLIGKFQANHTTELHCIYRDRLARSRHEFHGQQKSTISHECAPPIRVCIEYRARSQVHLASAFSSIRDALSPFLQTEKIIYDAGLWPPISLRTVLELLGSSAWFQFSGEWAEILIGLAEAIIEYQHSQRLVGFLLRSEVHNFFKELDNAIFDWSDARTYRIWLLIQVYLTTNILFRNSNLPLRYKAIL